MGKATTCRLCRLFPLQNQIQTSKWDVLLLFPTSKAIEKHHKEFKISCIIWNAMAHMYWVYKMTFVMLILPICASPVTCLVSKSTLQHCQNDNPAPMYLMIIENCRNFPTEIRLCLELTSSSSSALSCSWKICKALSALFKSSSSLQDQSKGCQR